RTASGNVTVRGASQDVTVNSVSGAVRVSGGPLYHGRVETVTGGIDFSASIVRGASLELQTHSGPVTVQLPPGSTDAEFTLSTFQGHLTNRLSPNRKLLTRPDMRGEEANFTNGQGGATFSVRTFSGDIMLAK